MDILLKGKEYDFLRENENLKNRIILLGLAGSYAYGTNNENSDIDVRGIALNKPSDIIGMTSFEQYVDNNTDTCIYSFNKIIKLLINCNPNTIELLGLKKEHYIYLNDVGRELIDNSKMFLSKRAIQSFVGYSTAQLRRLENALSRDTYSQERKEEHMLNSIKNSMYEFNSRYKKYKEGGIKLYIDNAENVNLAKEIFIDVDLKHYPLRDYENMLTQMNNIIKEYDKTTKKNSNKDDAHLNKHAMHLIRLYCMAIDILEKEEIITYRAKEHELLMDIRNGRYQNQDRTFSREFYDIIDYYKDKLDYAIKNTNLPEGPDIKRIEEFVMETNKKSINL